MSDGLNEDCHGMLDHESTHLGPAILALFLQAYLVSIFEVFHDLLLL